MKIRSAVLASVLGLGLATSGVQVGLPIDEQIEVSVENASHDEFSATATKDEVDLSWEQSPGELATVLLKDGQIIADVTSDVSFADGDVVSGEKTTYTLVSLLENDGQVPAEHPEAQLYDIRHIVIDVPDGAHGVPAEAAVLPNSSQMIYRTFIPTQYVHAPGFACAPDNVNYYFNGDNRSWSATSGSYKTQQTITVDWLNNGNVTHSPLVGQTILYKLVNGAYTIYDSGRASSSAIKLVVNSRSSTNVSFTMSEDVRNPLCDPTLTSGIYYDFDVNMSRSGSFSMTGYAITVPNHELYVRDSGLSWVTIFRRALTSFDCLIPTSSPLCTHYYPYSGTW